MHPAFQIGSRWQHTCTNLMRRVPESARKENKMLGMLLLIVLVVLLLGALPAWPYSREWGYYPSGGLGLVVVILLVLLLLGYI